MTRRVQSLLYAFVSLREHDRFDEAVPLETTLEAFDVALTEGRLIARPKRDYAEVQDARRDLEPLLRDWELATALGGSHRIKFRYESAALEDPKASPEHRYVYGELSVSGGGTVTVGTRRDNPAYPPPSPSFRASPVLEAIAKRIDDAQREPSLVVSNAQWLLTRVEKDWGGGKHGSQEREHAATALNVHPDVLNMIGKLAGLSDPNYGRKASGPEIHLTENDIHWLRAVMSALAWRIGDTTRAPIPGNSSTWMLSRLSPKWPVGPGSPARRRLMCAEPPART